MKLPLEGLKVLDLSRALAGPFCTVILNREQLCMRNFPILGLFAQRFQALVLIAFSFFLTPADSLPG